MTTHHITVTKNGPFGRAWFDCTCGRTRTCASGKAADEAAFAHHRGVIGCGCSREAGFDQRCLQRTNNPPNPKGATAEEQRTRYSLTTKGLIALVPRAACGHAVCLGRDLCALRTDAPVPARHQETR